MAPLRFQHVSFRYPDSDQWIIEDLSFSVNNRELVQILGRNGSGKTTLLRLIGAELTPSSGRICRAPNLQSVYLDQFAGEMLAPDLSLLEHAVAFADGTTADRGPLTLANRLREMLARFDIGLEQRLHHFAGELSGGQKQVLALVTALLRDALVLCLDEFTSNLDARTEKAAIELLEAHRASRDAIIFLVAHKPLPLVPTRQLSIH